MNDARCIGDPRLTSLVVSSCLVESILEQSRASEKCHRDNSPSPDGSSSLSTLFVYGNPFSSLLTILALFIPFVLLMLVGRIRPTVLHGM